MRSRWLIVTCLLSLILPTDLWAVPFALAQNQANLVVAPGFNHTPVLVDVTSNTPGFSCAATTAASNANWVTPSIDPVNQQLVLNFTTALLTNSSYAANISLTNGTDVQTLTINIALSQLNVSKLISDPFRPRVYGVQQSGTAAGSVIVYDPYSAAAVGCITVGKKPSSLAVSNNGTELYVLNSAAPSISVIDLVNLRVKEDIALAAYANWGASDTFGNIGTGPGNVLYYSDGAWAPALRVFDRVTKQVLQTIASDPSSYYGFGGFALSQDKTVFMTWAQYGWSAGAADSHISRYSVAPSGLLTFSQSTASLYPAGLMRDPLGTPVLGTYDNSRFFLKQWAVSPADINTVVQNYPSPVYSITPNGEVAVTNTSIIQKDTGNKLYDLPFATKVQAITMDYSKLVLFNPTTRALQTVDLMSILSAGAMGLTTAPANGGITTSPEKLQWSPIPGINTYQVYLTTSGSSLATATTASDSYLGQTNTPLFTLPHTLTPGVTYYWRVDSVLAQGITKGPVFSFTVSLIAPSDSKIVAATVTGHSAYQVSVGLSSPDSAQTWQAVADKPWVTFQQNSGTLPADLKVVLNAGSLPAGSYTATIQVKSGTTPSFSLPVTFKVEPLKVTILKSHPLTNRVFAISEDTATSGATAYLMELDSAAESILRVVPVGNSATDIAVHVPDGRIYVTNWRTGYLLAVDMGTFEKVRTYSFKPFAGVGYGQGDVYRISAGAAGRLVCEACDQWVDLSIYDTASGTVMKTTGEREGGGAFAPGGRYYYHGDNNISDASIHKYDVTGDVMNELATTRGQSFSYYGSRTVVMPESGNGIFWNGSYFDSNLNEQWKIGAEIYSCTPDAKYAIGNTSIYDTQLKQAVMSMPVSTNVSAFNGTSGKLVVPIGGRIGFYVLNPTVLSAPVLASGSVTSTSVTLTWTNQSLGTGFTLQKRITGSATWDTVASPAQNVNSFIVSNLLPGNSYDFRINANGTNSSSSWSNTVTVTLQGPITTYGTANGISNDKATLNATVNPGGVVTHAFFRYGVDTNYGSMTLLQSLGSGTSGVPISAALNGLSPNTTYHYQLVIETPDGTFTSSDQILQTLPGPVGSQKVIYNYVGRMSSCGDEVEFKIGAKGHLIWDPATNDISGIFTFVLGHAKGVSMAKMSAQQVFVFKGASGKEYTTIAIAQSTGSDAPFKSFEADLIKGRRYSVKIGDTTFKVPKSMTDSERFVDQAGSGEPVYVEMNGSYVIDVKGSAASNAAGESVDAAAARIKNSYLQKGYSDADL